jgi:hypothetical protein
MQGIHLRLQQLCHLASHYGFQSVGDGKSAFAHNKNGFTILAETNRGRLSEFLRHRNAFNPAHFGVLYLPCQLVGADP